HGPGRTGRHRAGSVPRRVAPSPATLCAARRGRVPHQCVQRTFVAVDEQILARRSGLLEQRHRRVPYGDDGDSRAARPTHRGTAPYTLDEISPTHGAGPGEYGAGP